MLKFGKWMSLIITHTESPDYFQFVREITKQKSKVSKFISVGKVVPSDLDFDFLDEVNRDNKSVEKLLKLSNLR